MKNLRINKLQLTNFRCFAEATWNFDADVVCLIGANGSGKTTVLESIYALGRARSFRGADNRELLKRDKKDVADEFQVRADITPVSDEDSTAQKLHLGLGWSDRQVRVRANGESIKGRSELADLFPVHLIGPEPHRLLTDGPAARRAWLDWGLFHVKHPYREAWKEYRQALRNRNKILNQSGDVKLLDAIEPVLAKQGERIHAYRAEYLQAIEPTIKALNHQFLELDDVDIKYQRGWAQAEELISALKRHREGDLRTGKTSVGPHRADIQIKSEGSAIGQRASRGQLKLWAMTLLLAQVMFHVEHQPRIAPLLIDDLMSELDEKHLQAMAKLLESLPNQKIITGVDPVLADLFKSSSMFHVEHQ